MAKPRSLQEVLEGVGTRVLLHRVAGSLLYRKSRQVSAASRVLQGFQDLARLG